ncbi:alpha-1,2-fucosyltransferase [Pedobacter sp. PF22-3]|uniref:alpha-1,2-fucosyltransferase n=1 Tax=Pedobacter sp. PF22-3 TaxID=2994467 RepID=UPI00224613E7|nr:alpha-1,2-fucosyltransferase [Pedobacter sp. PF22-3]MCX2492574.1 alpha-1,2-fucosyltransferase [Pedobacter sp. PF22-3]
MIGVELQGRLGNQLFQYAFAYATAKKLNTKFYLDPRKQRNLLNTYFEGTKDYFFLLDKYIFSRSHRNRISNYIKFGFYAKMIKLFDTSISFSDEVDPAENLQHISNNKFYSGFFQSADYFHGYENKVISALSIKKKFISEFEKLWNSLHKKKNIVVIHVRRSDYLDYGLNLSNDYYHRAISSIASPENFYIFITDDPGFVKSEFNYIAEDFYISSESEIIDFQFLMHSDINIISNSSFSWWGTYLNPKKPKVIAPKHWFKDNIYLRSPKNILISSWNLIDN